MTKSSEHIGTLDLIYDLDYHTQSIAWIIDLNQYTFTIVKSLWICRPEFIESKFSF